MRYLVVWFVLMAMWRFFTDDLDKAQFYLLGAILFVLMEIADNTRAIKFKP